MKSLAVLALPFVFTLAAAADTISGQFSLTGMSVTDDGSTLTFVSNAIQAGDSSTLYGSFQTLLTGGEHGTISSPIDYINYLPGSAQLLFTNGSSTLTFVINSIDIINHGDFRNFYGTGVVSTSLPGYTSQSASLLFTTQGNGTTTFAATAYAPAIAPEPSTLALLGTGILGGAAALRRRLS